MPTNLEQNVEPRVWSARLVDWFFKNTQIVLLLFLATVLGGGYSLATLKSEGFPSPQINVAVVTTLYRGASPETVESQIVKPIEQAVQGIKGVSDVHATSANSFGSVVVNFDATADFTSAISEVRNKIQGLVLPKDADKPSITVPSFGGSVSYYAVTGTDQNVTNIRAQGDFIKRELESVSGVKEFKLMQPITDKLLVNWRPADLAKYGLTPADLSQLLAANNITIPAGTLDVAGRNTNAVTVASFSSIDEINNLSLGKAKLSDVATVTIVNDNTNLLDQYNERSAPNAAATSTPALYYQLTYKDSVDVVKSSKLVYARISDFANAPELAGSSLKTVFNVADDIHEQVAEIQHGAIGTPIGTGPLSKAGYILGAIWLIFLAMLLFVSWRASVISVLAIPLSLLITFVALKIQGVSLNTLTLFSMVLVLALIVDPAIVLLEAIQRELDLGRRGRNAVIAAMNTVGIGAFIAVICNTLVFVPFGVVSGVFGEIIRFIPITVIPALIASYFVPIIFLTYLSRYLLKPAKNHRDDEEIANLWKASQWFVRTNTKILRTRWMQVVIMLFAVTVPLGVTGALFATGKVSPVQFSSVSDGPSYQVDVEYPANFDTTQKTELVRKVGDALKNEATTKTFFALMQSDTTTSLQVELFPRTDRTEDSTAIVKRMADVLTPLQNTDQRVFVTAKGSSIGGPTTDPVAVNIYGDDLAALRKAAIQTGDILRQQANVTRVNDGFTNENNPQIAIVIDRDKLAKTGLPAFVVAQTLSGRLGEASVTKYEQTVAGSTRQLDVYLKDADTAQNTDDIRNTIIGAGPTGPIHVSDIATVSETQGFTGINRLNGQRFVTVSAQVKDALKDAAAPQKAVKDFWTTDKLKQFGLRADALDSRGSGDEFLKSFSELFLALGAACFLLYVVLVLFFKSFAQPFIILFAIPLSFIGVFPALSLVGGQFGFLEILGIITLAGIAVNVGIFLIDLANQRRAQGMDYKQAIAEASGIRFRPIFLTKVTALGGLLPLILLSPFWRSLATVVLAGVLVSGILSLFTTPILYSWFIGIGNRVSRGWAKRFPHHSEQ
jgi:HAE1 family hydrophobic/amphiphilic exporter-1